ncbi:Hypothetical predicted protein [Olea europaea subsp. europaea]|uniref:Uncharacterized protein n=1 Tax=Olea europaea subsp. europaea TaxID=158383 RepID=A0A8S0QTP8_OLEEU|nr:Hypothetical predicted protein [Olea europaea subsp. europaea]
MEGPHKEYHDSANYEASDHGDSHDGQESGSDEDPEFSDYGNELDFEGNDLRYD